MATYILNGKQMIVNTEKLNTLVQRWLPKEMPAEYKKRFVNYVEFLIAGLELKELFHDHNGAEICIERYYFLACLIYAWNNGYSAIFECNNDFRIFNCLDDATKEIYDEFIERTIDEDGEVDSEYFITWINEENWDGNQY